MTWAAAGPAALITAAWCVLPGMLVARASGWRGIACWGSAPLISVALIATAAIGAGRIGIPWGPWPVVAATVFVAGAVLALRTGARISTRRRSGSPDSVDVSPRLAGTSSWRQHLYRSGPDGGHAGLALAVGMSVTIAISWLTVVLAFGPVDAISPTYDAVHHYNAVARILDTGDGSSLTVGELTTPGQPSFYPAAWHDLVALVVLSSASTVPVASNLVALNVTAVMWPLSCVLLLRQLVGRRPGAFLVGPILATAFTAMPWMLMSFGVLWPNLLGLALVPAGLAAGVTLLGLTRNGAFGRPGALLLGAVAVPAIGLAHPNAVISLLVLGLSPLAVGALAAAARWIPERRLIRTVAALAGVASALLAVLWLLAWSPFLAGVRSFDWPATMGRREAIRGVVWNGMNERPDLVAVSLLVIIGSLFALRRPRTAWLVPAHAASAFLYVLAVAQEGPLTTALTGAWYNDSYRLAAMIPITGVPLASIGVLGIAGLLVRAALRLRGAEPAEDRIRLMTTAAVAVVAAGLVLASGGFRIGVHAFVVAETYQQEATAMLQPGQREFLDEAGRLVPPDGVVAANPWTGNVLLYPLTGREVLFPHMSGRWTAEQQQIREDLRDAAGTPSVCAAVRASGVTHAIDGPVSFWPWDPRSQEYPGLTGLDAAAGFEPVASGGGSTLYRVTACDPDRVPG